MDIYKIPCLFGLPEADSLSELSAGHINRTFLADCGNERFVLQTLNRSVFHSPETVMHNISMIEAAFAKVPASGVAVPHFIACSDKNYAIADNEIWRMYKYVSATADTAASSAAVGRAFGTFLRVMDGSRLSDIPVIENFHNFDSYFRVLTSKSGIERSVMATLYKLRDDLGQFFTGALKKRVIHGDAKPDNIICGDICTIIDLDTAMYGHAAIDYGDLVRSVCRGNDIAAVREVTEGYADGLGGLLDADEVRSLYYGILWITGELAVRYLIDYRSEVKYFRGKSSADCLARAEELLSRLDFFNSRGEEIKEMIMSCFDL
jgi:Ser/Thr protein kinase RdoA (MazF antagonist)